MDAEEPSVRIMHAVLSNVMFDGWTDHAVRSGVRAAGFDRTAAARYFPGGIREVADRFADWADREMEARLRDTDLVVLRVPNRLVQAFRARFEVLEPHREALRSCLAFLALPQNLSLGVKVTLRTVDRIWYAIGDSSVDFSYYTKRASLAGVLGTATLYWLEDHSDGYAETWSFLDRRLADGDRRGSGTTTASWRAMVPSPRRFVRQVRRQAEVV